MMLKYVMKMRRAQAAQLALMKLVRRHSAQIFVTVRADEQIGIRDVRGTAQSGMTIVATMSHGTDARPPRTPSSGIGAAGGRKINGLESGGRRRA